MGYGPNQLEEAKNLAQFIEREKATEVARESQSGIAELNLRVAMLELRAKLWGGIIGMAAGGVGTVVVQLVMRSLQR